MKTRIFISCGQRKNTKEAELAQEIDRRLRAEFEDKYDPYLAVLVQSVTSLQENIFYQLSTSEYFLFIDFRREETVAATRIPLLKYLRPRWGPHRGSLFTHQELAIASFLKLETIAFHEEGVSELDGMRGVMQLNSELFVDRRHLVDRVIARVKKEWQPDWKNELSIELSPETGGGVPLHHYHLRVRNRHRSKIARDCNVFVESVVNLKTGEEKRFETLPLKWGGGIIPDAVILAGASRRFDSFQIHQQHGQRIFFKGYSDSGEFQPEILTAGIHRITYVVISSNFETVKATVDIDNTGPFNAAKVCFPVTLKG